MIELIASDSQTIFVDVVGPFGVTANAEQTKSPTEQGAPRSDHKVLNPTQLQIEAQQSEHPLDDPEFDFADLDFEVAKVRTVIFNPFLLASAGLDAAIGAVGNLLSGGGKPDKMQTYQTDAPRDRGGEVADQLGLLYAGDELATVSYRGRTYENMSLIGLGINYAPSQAGLTTFALTFEQVTIAEVGRVQLPDPNSLALKAQAALGKAGGPEGKEESGVSDDKGTSILGSMVGL